jgi:hypothetical protein
MKVFNLPGRLFQLPEMTAGLFCETSINRGSIFFRIPLASSVHVPTWKKVLLL